MKSLTLKQFQASGLLEKQNDYQKERIKADIARAEEISKFHPCEIVFNVSEHEGTKYFEHTNLKLAHDKLEFNIRFDDYRKKYHIYCPSITNLKNVTSYTMSDEKKKLTEPNQIGVLTTKKIMDWIKYYEQLYANLEAIDNKNNNQEAEFLASLKGHNVKFYNNGKSGEIIKNGIKFSFKIEPTYISQTIEVHYECKSNLDTFLKLADNKYKPSKK